MATTETNLKMIFSLSGSTKTTTLTLKEPKSNLKKSEVTTAAADIIGKNALKVDGHYPSALSDSYIISTTKSEIPEE